MKKLIKDSKAFVAIDYITAILVFCTLSVVVVSLMSNIYKQNLEVKIRSNAMAYVALLLEKIDETSYFNIVNNPNSLLDELEIDRSIFDINIQVVDVPNIKSSANDIMKVVNISVKYTFSGGTQYLNFSKLKIKEII